MWKMKLPVTQNRAKIPSRASNFVPPKTPHILYKYHTEKRLSFTLNLNLINILIGDLNFMMGRNFKLVFVLVVAIAVLLQGSGVLGGLCNMSDEGFASCKPAVAKATPEKPTPECREALKGADLKCLCGYKNSFLLPSLNIDPALAMALPAKCNLTPPADC